MKTTIIAAAALALSIAGARAGEGNGDPFPNRGAGRVTTRVAPESGTLLIAQDAGSQRWLDENRAHSIWSPPLSAPNRRN